MPGGLFKKRRGEIWTAAADNPPQIDGVVNLFAPDDDPKTDAAANGTPTDGEAQAALSDGEDEAKERQWTEDEPDSALWLFEENHEETRQNAKAPRNLWAWVLGLLILAFFAFAFITLRVENIEVQGNEQLDRETIVKTSGVEYKKSMFFLRRHSYEDKLCAHPYIASAKVELSFPNTVRITVKERKEAAVILGLGTVAVIDEDGYVMSIGQRASYAGLVKLYGAGAAGYQVGGHIGDMDDYASHALTALIAAIKKSHVQDMIESADLSNTLSVTLLSKSGVTINLGTAEDLDIKLQRLAIVMPELDKLGYTNGTLFLYTHGSPIYSPPSTPKPTDDAAEDGGNEGESEYTYVPSDRSNDTASPSPSPEGGRQSVAATPGRTE